MEFFQTIWTMLTTPNEGVANLVNIPMGFIEATVSMLLFTTILNISSNKKQKLIYLLLAITISIFTNTLLFEYSKFINVILLPILVILIFKTSILKGIFSQIVPAIILSIFEPILMGILETCFAIGKNEISLIPLYRILYLTLMYLYAFILYKVCKHLEINITFVDNMSKRNKIVLCINLIIGIISILMQSYLYYRFTLPAITLLGMISLLVYFLLSMYSLIRTTKLEVTEQSLEEAQLYNKSLKILHDNVRGFKHDFSNIVQAIGRICFNK